MAENSTLSMNKVPIPGYHGYAGRPAPSKKMLSEKSTSMSLMPLFARGPKVLSHLPEVRIVPVVHQDKREAGFQPPTPKKITGKIRA
jgi:hypothetical protein